MSLLLVGGGVPARAQSASCGTPDNCGQILLGNFAQFLTNPQGQAILTANAQTEVAIYTNASPSARALAATNAQLTPTPQGGSFAIQVPTYNDWNMANPAVATALNQGFNQQNQAVLNYYNLLYNIEMPSLKSYFAGYGVYATIPGFLPGDIYNDPVGDPRPLATLAAVYGNPWTSATSSAFAAYVQQNPASVQSWAGLNGSDAFPSGHSEVGNAIGIMSAILTPQYYKSLVLAGVEFAYSRQVFGAHYPLDAIGGRLVAMYSIAQMLNGTNGFPSLTSADMSQVSAPLQAYLGSGGSSPYAAACQGNVIGCIRAGAIPTAAQFAADRATYTWYLTYGLPNYSATNVEPIVPVGAEVLIATRFPYLTQSQLQQVLLTTEIPSGSALDNGSGWARLNLFAAADGFGAFNSDQTVTMNAAAGGYNAFDVWANPITGPGGLTLAGTGTLVLAGDSTFTGGTNVAGGMLAVTGSITGAVDVASGASFYNAGTVTALNGSVVTNAGTVVNDGTITGSVFNSGAFNNNGTVGGSLVTYGLLSGNGTIGGLLTIADGGTVAPGNSIGTLHVGGNVVFQPGSTYAVQIDTAGGNDAIVAAGTATISGATVALSVDYGALPTLATYPILTAAGGVTGQFAAVNNPFGTAYPFLTAALGYGPTGVFLQTVRSGVPFNSAAQNANQYAVASALDTVPTSAPIVNAAVSLNDSTAPAAFTALSGGIYPSIDTVLQAQSVYLRDAVTDRLRQAAGAAAAPAVGPKTAALIPGLLPTVWTQAYGSWGDSEGSGGVADVSRSVGGFVTGIDNPIGDNARIGIAGGYSQTEFNSNTLSSSGDSDNYDLAIYGGAKFGALGLRLGASYTWHDISVNRTVAFPGFSNALSSSYDAGTTQVFADVGYGISTPYADLEPFASAAYVNLHTSNMSEGGGAAALQGASGTQDNTFTTLGLRAAKGFAVNGGVLTTSLSLGWQYVFGDTTPVSTLSFEAGGAAFQESGTPIARNAARIGAGFDFAATPNVNVGLHYSGQLAGSSQDNAIDGRVSIKF